MKRITHPERLILLTLMLLWMAGCHGNTVEVEVEVELREIKNDLAYFDVFNHNDKDIKAIEFEVSFIDSGVNLPESNQSYRWNT